MIPPSGRGLLAAALLLAACGGETSVRIGLAGPFGDERGAAMRVAAQLAIEELNAAGGIRGRPVDLVLLDDSANAQGAIAVARELSSDPSVVAVVGHLTSGATLAAAPTYGGTPPVTLLSPSASSPLLTQAGPWVFRLCPGDDLHGAALAAWARDRLGADIAAILGGYQLVLGPVFAATLGSSLIVRIALTGALVSVPGFLMGTAFPSGLARAPEGPRRTAWVSFAWALNGYASVAGTVVAMTVAIESGFTVVLLLGAACYALACVVAALAPAPERIGVA